MKVRGTYLWAGAEEGVPSWAYPPRPPKRMLPVPLAGGFTWGGLGDPSLLAHLALLCTCCVTMGQEAPPF